VGAIVGRSREMERSLRLRDKFRRDVEEKSRIEITNR
jgi:hypothetical protein